MNITFFKSGALSFVSPLPQELLLRLTKPGKNLGLRGLFPLWSQVRALWLLI